MVGSDMAQRISVDAKTFQNEWLRHHEGRQPIRWMLRASGLPWVRFHALPGSKRYAENEDERQTIIFRANVLGDRLLRAGTPCWLVPARAAADLSAPKRGVCRRPAIQSAVNHL